MSGENMNEKQDFTTGNISVKLVKFMIPILGALVLQAMYGAVDMLIVGQFGSEAGVSAVSTGSSIVNIVVFTIAGLSMGVTVLISRYLGEGKAKSIGKVLGGVIAVFVVLSVILTVFLLVAADGLAILMQAPKEARELTALYVRICGGGILFIIAYNVISSIFRGLGDSKNPLIFVAIACAVNIVGDLLFVAVFKWDVAGAAIATVLAQVVSVVLSILIIKKQKLPIEFTLKDIGFNSEVKKFVMIGIPIALQELLTNASFLALCAFINRLGLEESSGYGISQKVVSFILLIPSSIMQSMSSVVAQNVGANDEKRAKKAMYSGMLIGAGIGVVITIATLLFGEPLSAIFTKNTVFMEKSAEYLIGFSIEPIVTSILFSYMGYFSGHGKTVFVMAQGLAQTFLVRLPVSYIMSIRPDANLTEIGIAAPAATIFGIVLCTIYFVIMNRSLSCKVAKNVVK